MAGHVLHVFANVANAHYTGLLADAVADHQVYDEAPEWITPETWQTAASVLVEADTVDQLARQHLPRRPRTTWTTPPSTPTPSRSVPSTWSPSPTARTSSPASSAAASPPTTHPRTNVRPTVPPEPTCPRGGWPGLRSAPATAHRA
jgi:hypothetical protein